MLSRALRHGLRSSVSRSAIVTLLFGTLQATAAVASPLNADGDVGLTSYATLPWAGSIFQLSWGSGNGFDPAQWFWRSGSHFTDASTMGNARGAAWGWSNIGIVPTAQAQRWEDTYEVAQPASLFPNEPGYADGSNFAGDRASGYASGPEFKAWTAWLSARPGLLIMANDGGSVPTYFRPWGGSWGHVSPLMPLASSDCPNGMTSCVFGDWAAARWGETAALSGAYGIGLSDFSTAQPGISTQMGYNPALIGGFQAAEGVGVPSGNTSQQSAWIIANAMPQWNDYLSSGYAHFLSALQSDVQFGTGQSSLVIQQCSLWPALLRFYGLDQRLISDVVPAKNYICEWDEQSMQIGRGGQDPVYGLGAYAIAAAREPNLRNGVNLEANDAAYWNAIAYFNPALNAADQQEKGLKLLKRAWLEAAWAHVATRQGTVRRAMSFMSRDYWDAGSVDPTVASLASSIVPTAPFGMAVYYSTAAERAREQQIATGNPYTQAYGAPSLLYALKNEGVPVDYFVSDAALPALTASARPAAWIILEHPELIPSAEMQTLTAIAPVLTTTAAVQAFQAPLTFSSGLTGTAFYDQNGRLIVTATNPAAGAVGGFVTLRGLADGTYASRDLVANNTSRFVVSGGSVSLPLSVARWDTDAFAITRQ